MVAERRRSRLTKSPPHTGQNKTETTGYRVGGLRAEAQGASIGMDGQSNSKESALRLPLHSYESLMEFIGTMALA